MNARIRFVWAMVVAVVATVILGTTPVLAQKYERRDVTFKSQGLDCAAWYYVPAGLKPGEKRPAIVMAHGFSAVKEMYLDNYASKFAAAGFVVLVFDYRYFGGSAGEPRSMLLWPEQIMDYRNAITWAALQPQVDPQRIGVWGTSYSGGHAMYLAAYDKRIKAVVAQVPVTNVWSTTWRGGRRNSRRASSAGSRRTGRTASRPARSTRSPSPRRRASRRSGRCRNGTTRSWI